jgi:hypothetical protein
MAKVTIWINRENEVFWEALENKSGWVNMVIEALLEEQKKRLKQEEEFIKKYGSNEEHEEFVAENKV